MSFGVLYPACYCHHLDYYK